MLIISKFCFDSCVSSLFCHLCIWTNLIFNYERFSPHDVETTDHDVNDLLGARETTEELNLNIKEILTNGSIKRPVGSQFGNKTELNMKKRYILDKFQL